MSGQCVGLMYGLCRISSTFVEFTVNRKHLTLRVCRRCKLPFSVSGL